MSGHGRGRTWFIALSLTLLASACGTANAPRAAIAPYAGTSLRSAVPVAYGPLKLPEPGTQVDYRADLTAAFSEQVYLTAMATGAVLRGDTSGANAWADALTASSPPCGKPSSTCPGVFGPGVDPGFQYADVSPAATRLANVVAGRYSNSAELAGLISYAYGAQSGAAFSEVWRSQDNLAAFLAYAQALAGGDSAGARSALGRLQRFATSFGQVMHRIDSSIPTASGQNAFHSEVAGLQAVIADQKSQDWQGAYASLDTAYRSLDGFAQTLAVATAAEFPKTFPTLYRGGVNSPTAGLQARLTSLMQEAVLLAGSADRAAGSGRSSEARAAQAALVGVNASCAQIPCELGTGNSNTAAIGDAMASVYGAPARAAFASAWVVGPESLYAGSQPDVGGDAGDTGFWGDSVWREMARLNPAFASEEVPVQDVVAAMLTSTSSLGIDQRAPDFGAIQVAQFLAAGTFRGLPQRFPLQGDGLPRLLLVGAGIAGLAALLLAGRSYFRKRRSRPGGPVPGAGAAGPPAPVWEVSTGGRQPNRE